MRQRQCRGEREIYIPNGDGGDDEEGSELELHNERERLVFLRSTVGVGLRMRWSSGEVFYTPPTALTQVKALIEIGTPPLLYQWQALERLCAAGRTD